jgi:hypothetical protein
MMKKVAQIVAGAALIIAGCYCTIIFWDTFVLAVKGTIGIIFLLAGAFAIYFARKGGTLKKLADRVTHNE